MGDSFRTELQVDKSEVQMSLKDKVLTIGSCFSDSMGARLMSYKFDVLANPYGTIYNPISIFKLLTSSGINTRGYVHSQGMTFHHDVHSDLRAENQRLLENQLQDKKTTVLQHLRQTDWVIVTLGTAWVYEAKETGQIVANCHKVPQESFTKRLLGMKEMALAMDDFYAQIKKINSKVKILFTVSPVRHIKDGIAENQLSKSMLRVLCDFAVSSHEDVHYFPAYELMLDDLRDYRWYKQDMIHPTDQAEDYIWKTFIQAYMDVPTVTFIKEWKDMLAALNHRPFNPSTEKHQDFLQKQLEKLASLSNLVDVSEERQLLEAQLSK